MQSWPLTVDRILDHAASSRPDREIVAASPDGLESRITYAALGERTRRLAGALAASGVRRGDVVAVIGANTIRQIEAWYAITGIGAVCHPLDPNASAERLAARLREGGDKLAFVDPVLLPSLDAALLQLPRLERIVAMSGPGEALETRLQGVVAQDDFAEEARTGRVWGAADESEPAVLLHTVGPSQDAKGVVWTHRSCVLQALLALGPDGLDLSSRETVLALTPFWRSAAWGLAFAAPMAGARLVLPGARADMASLRALVDAEAVSLVVGSPAELQGLHARYREEGRRPNGLKRAVAVGAPCPAGLAKAWRASFGVEVRSGWGLTETSALGAVFDPASPELRPPFGLELEITDAAGRPLRHDGAVVGRLKARGPVVADGYAGAGHATDDAGFLDTGDLARIQPDGRVILVGRADDMVVMDGALVAARIIEEAALEHPSTAAAAVIDPPAGFPQDGPVLLVQRNAEAVAGKADYLRFITDRLGPAAGPAEVFFVDGLPLDAAGRVDKKTLRRRLERLAPAPEPAAVPAEPSPDLAGPELEPGPESEAQVSEAPAAALAEAAAATPVLYAPEEDEASEPVAEAEPEAEIEPEGEAEPLVDEPDVAAPDEASEPAPPDLEPEPAVAEGEAGLVSETEDHEPEVQAPEPAAAVEAAPLELPHRSDEPLRLMGDEPGLFANFQSRPKPRRRAWLPAALPATWREADPTDLFLVFAMVVALVPLATILVGAAGIRLGLIDWRIGLHGLMNDWPFKSALVALAVGIVAFFSVMPRGFARWRQAALCLAVPALVLAGLVAARNVEASFPPVHDVATDWSDPVVFSAAAIKARGPDANPVEPDPIVPADAGAYMNRRVADVNAETCPGARPVVVAVSPDQAYARAKQAVSDAGLRIVGDDAHDWRLEAVASSSWLGFKDDLAVRVTPDPKGARVDFRSISRNGQSDLGANCARVGRLVQAVESGVG